MLKFFKRFLCGLKGHEWRLLAVGLCRFHSIFTSFVNEGSYYTIKCTSCEKIKNKQSEKNSPDIIKLIYGEEV